MEVFIKFQKQLEIIHEMKKRKLGYLGQVMRGPRSEIIKHIIQGKIVGKTSVKRRRVS